MLLINAELERISEIVLSSHLSQQPLKAQLEPHLTGFTEGRQYFNGFSKSTTFVLFNCTHLLLGRCQISFSGGWGNINLLFKNVLTNVPYRMCTGYLLHAASSDSR